MDELEQMIRCEVYQHFYADHLIIFPGILYCTKLALNLRFGLKKVKFLPYICKCNVVTMVIDKNIHYLFNVPI